MQFTKDNALWTLVVVIPVVKNAPANAKNPVKNREKRVV